MKYFILVVGIVLLSCEKHEYKNDDNNPYSECINYFDIENYNTHYYILSLAQNYYGNILLSTFGCVDTSTVVLLEGNELINYDTNNFSMLDKSMKIIYSTSDKVIWKSKELIILFDKNGVHCKYWTMNKFSCSNKSSMIKVDKSGNLWEASIEGIKFFNGKEWKTYFDGICFYAICFDNNDCLYASTMPDFEGKGIILKFDYNRWDTIYQCTEDAKWVPCMSFDQDNNLWFGILSRNAVAPDYGGGVMKFNGNNFLNYNIHNSELPSNSVIEIAIDNNNNKWIGMYAGGLAKITDKNEWKLFNSKNTPMPFESIEHILVDDDENIWIAIQFYGLAKFRE